jgi:hypothetical protein
VSVDNLLGRLQIREQRGITEFICHPEYVDADSLRPYTAADERAIATFRERVRSFGLQGRVLLI